MTHLATRRSNTLVAVLAIAGSCLATGCVVGDPTDEETDGPVVTARQREIDSGTRVWRKYLMTLNDTAHTQLATVYLFNQVLGSYVPGTEYWFVNGNATSMIGRYALTISVADSISTTPPPDPSYASEQSFTLSQSSSWGTGWSSDPVAGGTLYNGPNHLSLRLVTSTGSAPTITEIAWYQAIPSGNTAANFTPIGVFSAGSSSFAVPPGYLGYDINERP